MTCEKINNLFSQDFKTLGIFLMRNFIKSILIKILVTMIKESEKTSFLQSAEHSELDILVKSYSCN